MKIKIFTTIVFLLMCNSASALHEYGFSFMNPVQLSDGTTNLMAGMITDVDLYMYGTLADTYIDDGYYSYWIFNGGYLDITHDNGFSSFQLSSTGEVLLSGGSDPLLLFEDASSLAFDLQMHSWELYPGGLSGGPSEPYHYGGYIPSSYGLTLTNVTEPLAIIEVVTVPLPGSLVLFLSSLIGLGAIQNRITRKRVAETMV